MKTTEDRINTYKKFNQIASKLA